MELGRIIKTVKFSLMFFNTIETYERESEKKVIVRTYKTLISKGKNPNNSNLSNGPAPVSIYKLAKMKEID